MLQPTYEQLLATYNKKNYVLFTKGNWNLNLFGIRTNDNTPNVFNDFIGYFCFVSGKVVYNIYEATTDPGTYYLKNPINVKGTAILVPGQYLRIWKIDLHNGKYKALCQRYGAVKLYRDNNKDIIIDKDVSTIESASGSGINIHRAAPYYIPFYIGPFSAGCQVIRKSTDFGLLMNAVYRSADIHGNVFSYTLFEENDFDS